MTKRENAATQAVQFLDSRTQSSLRSTI